MPNAPERNRLWPAQRAATWLLVVWLLGLFWPAALAHALRTAGTHIVLDGRVQTVPLADRSLAWVDESGQMGIDQIEARAASLPFAPRERTHRVRLGTNGALWVRFEAWTQDTSTHWEL